MTLPPQNSIIGIWGFGRVGKSATAFFHARGYKLAVMDSNRNISSDNFIKEHAIPVYHQSEHDAFFSYCSYVLVSPGIDIRPCKEHAHQWISELDLFYALWQKPIIAITGSIGKTTTTSILTQLCHHNNIPVACGGNIGIPMLDLLPQRDTAAYAVLEVSSFQLEHCVSFAPDIALITNIHANHLDRHETLENYWHAKARIFAHQQKKQHLLAPLTLRERINECNFKSNLWHLSNTIPSDQELKAFSPDENIVWHTETAITLYRTMNYQTFQLPKALFACTFPMNALAVYSMFHIMQQVTNNEAIQNNFDCDYVSYPHRLELVATVNNITFVNDSKSTTIASTLAALERYNHAQIILLLGGLSKGANREELIAQLPRSVIFVACFGAEALQLAAWCAHYGFAHQIGNTLDEAFKVAYAHATANSTLLLSPSGSSFDLYENYEKRGEHFRTLVHQFEKQYPPQQL